MNHPLRRPAEVFGLNEYLYDEFVARGWKTVDAARLFDNGKAHHLNLMALNKLMLGDKARAPQFLIAGLSNALCVSEQFFLNLEQVAFDHPDRLAVWICPVHILSQEMQDYIA
jgi:hypothetical protein